eukprot:g1675.t1
MLMAVFRGKISEGIDFSDRYARAVLIVGIPYPSFADVRVKLKKAHLDSQAVGKGSSSAAAATATSAVSTLSGAAWYTQCAFRATNQALGRCIRHSKDFGAILFLDSRYTSSDFDSRNLSHWVGPSLQRFGSDIQSSTMSLRGFFQTVRQQFVASVSHPKATTTAQQQRTGSNKSDKRGKENSAISRSLPRTMKESGTAKRAPVAEETVMEKKRITKKKRIRKKIAKKPMQSSLARTTEPPLSRGGNVRSSSSWGSDEEDFAS